MRPLIPLLLLVATGPALAWGECEHRAERTASIDAAGLRSLLLRAGAGDLEVVGEAGRTAIDAVGTACADSPERLAAIGLESGREGDRARLAAVLPDSSGGWFGDRYATLSLVVRVPEALAVDATDSSGDARFEGFASLAVEDSSGDLRIARVAGAVSIADSSGNIEVRGGRGPVQVRRDSSGDIDISGVVGDVQVVGDSSGNIELRDIGGAARIDSDSSGDIVFEGIVGDAEVGSDGSGDIVFEGIAGDAEVGSDGSGSIRARRIGGAFIVRADDSGGISHDEVKGPVSIPAD